MSLSAPHIHVMHVDSGQEWQSVRDQVSLLVEGLTRHHDIRQAVATLESSRLAAECEALGVPVVPLPRTLGSDPRALQLLARSMRAPWNLMHAHDGVALGMMVYIQALEGSNVPLVASRRYTTGGESESHWRRASLVLASSSSVRRAMTAAGVSPGRVVVLPNGVDPDLQLSPTLGSLREAIGALPEHRLVASFTALTKNRDHSTLLKAARLLGVRDSQIRFAILGRGPERTRIEDLVDRYELEGRVCLPGYLPDARAFMRELDVFVMPAFDEELTSACLEALAAGVPVVMPTIDAAGLSPEDGIVRVPVEDPGAMADAIQRLVSDPEHRAEVVRRGKLFVRRFGPAALVDRTLQVYRRVARRYAA